MMKQKCFGANLGEANLSLHTLQLTTEATVNFDLKPCSRYTTVSPVVMLQIRFCSPPKVTTGRLSEDASRW